MSTSKANKADRNGRSQFPGGSFFPAPQNMVQSAAWRSLKPASVKVFMELSSYHNGSNNGEIHLSLRQGANVLGMSTTTVQRALKELVDHGFIIQNEPGTFKGRRATTYILTSQKFETRPPTNDWKKWKPSKPEKNNIDDTDMKQKSSDGYSHETANPLEFQDSIRRGHLRVINGTK